MCQKIQQLIWDSLRMAPTGAETRCYTRRIILVGEHELHLGNFTCGSHIQYMFNTTFYLILARFVYQKVNCVRHCNFYVLSLQHLH
jgi:hypothetical protein